MKLIDVARTRLMNQHLVQPRFKTIQQVVGWMGALQAQDYAMTKWAIGIRLPDATDTLVQAAINAGEIIRTHVLRPTWHFVSAENIRWMLALTAPRIKASLESRHRELGLSKAVIAKSTRVIVQALRDGNHLTRDELVTELHRARIATDENRASHLFMCAELDLLISSGRIKNDKQTYALLDERVPSTQPLERDEALARLANIYFTSHGPATVRDFAWWSGLALRDAKHALELAQPNLASEIIEAQTYWFADSAMRSPRETDALYMLPAFDEWIISYQDRSAVFASDHFARAVSSNGVFYPTIVAKGHVQGTWKRTIKKDVVMIETELFDAKCGVTPTMLEKASVRYGKFLGLDVRIQPAE